jgi:hypothetical protein
MSEGLSSTRIKCREYTAACIALPCNDRQRPIARLFVGDLSRGDPVRLYEFEESTYIRSQATPQMVKGLAVSLELLVLQVIVATIIIGPLLWLAGRLLVGKEKAKFTDGLVTVALGTIIGGVLSYVGLSGWIAAAVMLVVWLALIKHFFDCGWLKALAIAIVAVVIFIVIIFVLVALGFAALGGLLPSLGV